jgi:hypothetical protein
MKESLIICPRCQGNACSEISNEKLTIWNCFGCGYTSNSTMVEANIATTEEVLPELYKAIKFIDDNGYHWYPNTVILDNKAMVFAEGKTKDDWKWSAVKAKKGKADMTTKKEYDQLDFMEGLDYIKYFDSIK